MVYIENATEFIQLIYKHDEAILFANGAEEKYVTLEFLKYTNALERICCITKERVDIFNNVFQNFEYSLPIIPLEYLPHFHESGLMIIAAPPQLHEELEQQFTLLGFLKIIFLHPVAIKQMQAYINQVANSGEAFTWYINNLMKKFDALENLITEQNEICAVNTKTFAQYQNCFHDKEIAIVGSGPTARYYAPSTEVIHIGLNFAWRREDISFDYLFMHDARLKNSEDANIEDCFDKIKRRIFVGTYPENGSWLNFSENFSLDEKKFARYYLNAADFNQVLNKDICYHGLADFGSVAFAAFHFALFTYPKKIYLVGCDTKRIGYFYNTQKKSLGKEHMFNIRKIKVGYARIKMFAKQYFPDTEIISINPVGLKGLFQDVYTDDYKASLS